MAMGNHLSPLSACAGNTQGGISLSFPVLKMTVKRTSLAFIPLVLVADVELIGGSAGCIDKQRSVNVEDALLGQRQLWYARWLELPASWS